MTETPIPHPSRPSLQWWPSWKITILCLIVDSAFAFGMVTYYETLSYLIMDSFLQSLAGAWAEVFGLVIPNPGAFVGFLAVYWLIPVLLYSFFKAIKLPILALGTPAFIENPGVFFRINLIFAALGFAAFAMFEWLGEMIIESFSPLIAGGFLAVALIHLSVWMCITHAVWYTLYKRDNKRYTSKRDNKWYNKEYMNGASPKGASHMANAWARAADWKLSSWYYGAGTLAFIVVNVVSYVALSYAPLGMRGMIAQGLNILGFLVPMACINAFQWRLLHNAERKSLNNPT